jgi:hypothetical protein
MGKWPGMAKWEYGKWEYTISCSPNLSKIIKMWQILHNGIKMHGTSVCTVLIDRTDMIRPDGFLVFDFSTNYLFF